MTPSTDDAASTLAWQHAPRVLWRRSGGTTAVSCPGQYQPLLLVGAGGPIWELLRDPITEDELVVTLAEESGAEAEQVRSDVRSFLRELANADAIRATPFGGESGPAADGAGGQQT